MGTARCVARHAACARQVALHHGGGDGACICRGTSGGCCFGRWRCSTRHTQRVHPRAGAKPVHYLLGAHTNIGDEARRETCPRRVGVVVHSRIHSHSVTTAVQSVCLAMYVPRHRCSQRAAFRQTQSGCHSLRSHRTSPLARREQSLYVCSHVKRVNNFRGVRLSVQS